MSDPTPVPDTSDTAVKVRKDATGNVALVALLVCGAAAFVFFVGAGVGNGWPAALAVCGLSAMGAVMGYLILRRP
jgi:hypothetical protein